MEKIIIKIHIILYKSIMTIINILMLLYNNITDKKINKNNEIKKYCFCQTTVNQYKRKENIKYILGNFHNLIILILSIFFIFITVRIFNFFI